MSPVVAGRLAAYAVCACTGFYLVLPVSVPVPGLVTVSALEASAALLVALALLRGDRAGFGVVGRAAAALLPLVVLAGWLLVVNVFHPVLPGRDAIFAAGVLAGAAAGLALAAALADPAARARATGVIIATGAVAIAFALVEPFTVPAWDPFWRIFRPAAEDPVLHGIEQGQFRVAGIFSDQNHLANFLTLWFPLAAIGLVGTSGACAALGWAGLAVAAYVFAHTLTRSGPIATGAGAFLVAFQLLFGAMLGRAKAFPDRATSRRPRRAWRTGLGVACWGLLVAAVATWYGTGHLTAVVIALVLAAFCLAIVSGSESENVRLNSQGGWRFVPTIGFTGALVCVALPLLARTEPVTTVRLDSSAETAVSWRRTVWTMAARDVTTSPVTGAGSHAFMAHLRGIPHGLMPGVSDAHQLHLVMALAGGIPAVGLVLHLLVCLLRLARWTAAGGAGVSSRPLGVALLWYWIAFMPLTLVGQTLFPVNEALFFSVIAGLTVAPYAARAR